MSRHTQNAANVVDLTVVREQKHAPRRTDGRRLGNHGNRADELTRAKTVADLRDILTLTGELTAADKEHAAAAAGVCLRTVNRWWSRELDRQVAFAVNRLPSTSDDATATPAHLPAWLYRHAEPAKLQLTEAEIAYFARHGTIKAAIDAVRSDPAHRLSKYGTSTLYAAYGNVTAPIRDGARRGAKAGRRIEATFPLTGRDAINESWSIDELDLKLVAEHHGHQVEPKILIVRERCSGTPLSYVVLPRAATGQDTGVVLAAAAIGYTLTHPNDPTRPLHVGGVARHLTSDQGGAFLGETGVAAARRLGIGLTPVPSHQPQANGDHEVMHQSLLRHLADGAGSRRGWTDRTGARLSHGVLPYDTVLELVEDWFVAQLATPYTSGPRRGRSRIQVYADHVDAGSVYLGHDLSAEDEGAVAYPVTTRKYDPTRGVHYANQYWLSPQLASAANPGETIELRQLVNETVLYAYDTRGRFLGLLRPRDEADLADIDAVHAARVRREAFVKDRVARPRARAAVADAVAAADQVADAEAAQHELGERLADAVDRANGVDPDIDNNDDVEELAQPRAVGAADTRADSRTRPEAGVAQDEDDAAASARANRYARRRGTDPGGDGAT
ncbi:hypothetical protein [Pedococcus bigeumensis]|uniref:hypothetical protein n=1 Tax=Pedococcus bigeumensis TaxID=433644 RepID=UPI002FE896E5